MSLMDKLRGGGASGLDSDNPLQRMMAAEKLGNSAKASAAEPLATAFEAERDDDARTGILRSMMMLYADLSERTVIAKIYGNPVSREDEEALARLRAVPPVAAGTRELDEKAAAALARVHGKGAGPGD
jgi:hypothetical protein